ncbi:ABC transporter substrate-binding protein [Spirochaetia bacterium]|nr:ABC transporter substrate-binding protein [Spirochaetia bacterium]
MKNMKKLLLMIFRAALFCMIFSFCPALVSAMPRQESRTSGQNTITDALGRPLSVSGDNRGYYRRIVSLTPAVTEILFAIGAGGQTVGITEYCNYPPEAQSLKRVGGFSGAQVSVEQIAALKADLVILSAEMHRRIIGLLDELAIPSFAVEPRNLSEVYETIAIIGELTGHVDGAATVIGEMQTKIASAEEQVRGKDKPGVFWVLQDEPLLTAGGGTFINEIITLGGGRNIFGELEEQWPLIAPEQVFLRRPDWILSGNDAPPPDRTALSRRPGWAEIPAIKNNRVRQVDADIFYRYGPRFADAVLVIAEMLHK